jgi:pyrophosphatase PpaX
MSDGGAPRYPVVLFDLDGTLVDTIPLIVASFQHVGETLLGRRLDDAWILGGIGRPLADVLAELAPNRRGELVDAYRAFQSANLDRLIRRVPGIEEALDALVQAGCRIGLATSRSRTSTWQILAAAGLHGRFDHVVVEEDTTAHKPDPAPVLAALDNLGADDGTAAIYVGDAAVDLLAARAAGIDAAAVLWGASSLEDLMAVHYEPRHVCRRPADIVRVAVGGDG